MAAPLAEVRPGPVACGTCVAHGGRETDSPHAIPCGRASTVLCLRCCCRACGCSSQQCAAWRDPVPTPARAPLAPGCGSAPSCQHRQLPKHRARRGSWPRRGALQGEAGVHQPRRRSAGGRRGCRACGAAGRFRAARASAFVRAFVQEVVTVHLLVRVVRQPAAAGLCAW